jgi:hypothetical protein
METELHNIHLVFLQHLIESETKTIKDKLKAKTISQHPQNKQLYQYELDRFYDILHVICPITNQEQGYIIISPDPEQSTRAILSRLNKEHDNRIIAPTMKSELFDTHLVYIRRLIERNIEELQTELGDEILLSEDRQRSQHNLARYLEMLEVIYPMISKRHGLLLYLLPQTIY